MFAADPWFPPVVQWIMSLRKKVSSSKKGPQPSLGPSTSSDKTSPVASETSKARLLELFSLIEKEFESLHSENAARETQIHSHTHIKIMEWKRGEKILFLVPAERNYLFYFYYVTFKHCICSE